MIGIVVVEFLLALVVVGIAILAKREERKAEESVREGQQACLRMIAERKNRRKS